MDTRRVHKNVERRIDTHGGLVMPCFEPVVMIIDGFS